MTTDFEQIARDALTIEELVAQLDTVTKDRDRLREIIEAAGDLLNSCAKGE